LLNIALPIHDSSKRLCQYFRNVSNKMRATKKGNPFAVADEIALSIIQRF
jgi:hypothetical protein